MSTANSNNNNNWRLQQVLDDNEMEMPEIGEGPSTLMMAVSMAVLGSVDHADQLQQYCKKYVKNLIETKTVSKKMESLVQGERWMIDYYTNPQLKCFERLNLELVSVVFSAKVIVYTINQEQLCLKAVIYNNSVSLTSNQGNNVISLYQHDHKHYHCAKFKKPLEINHIEEELLNNILGADNIPSNKSSPTMKATSKEVVDIPAEIIVPKKIEQQGITNEEPQQSLSGHGEWTQHSGQRRQSFQRRHKKSLSDTFNPFQVRVPNEFLDLFKGSNDFTANAQFLSLISAHHSTFAQKDNNNNSSSNNISTFADMRQTPLNQNNSMLNNNSSNENNNIANREIGNQGQNLLRQANNREINNLSNHSNIFNIEEHDEILGMTNHINNNNNQVNNPPLGSNIQGNISNETQLNEQNQQHNQHGQLHHQPIDFFNSMPQILQSFPTAPINLLSPNFNEIPQLPPSSLQKPLSFTNPSQQQQQSVLSQIQNNNNNNNSQQQQQQLQSINENLRRYMGSLKFFDENKNYGFIVMDDDNRDIFVHYDDLQKAGITKEFLKSSKQGNVIRFSFSCMQYIGKYKQSKKAVELQVMPYNPALSALRRQYHFSYISATPSS